MGISATKWSQKLKGNKQILFFILPLLKPFQGSLEFCTKLSEFPSLTTTTKTKKCIEVSKNYMNTYNHGKTCLDKIALAVVGNITKSRPPAYFTRWKRTSQQLKIALENKATG